MLRALVMIMLIRGVIGYGNLISQSLEMIRDHSYKYGVDDSHNHKNIKILNIKSEIKNNNNHTS